MTTINISSFIGMSYLAMANTMDDFQEAYDNYKHIGRGCMIAIYSDNEAKERLKNMDDVVRDLKYFVLSDVAGFLGASCLLAQKIGKYNPEKEYVVAFVIGFTTGNGDTQIPTQVFSDIITIE